MEIEKKYLLDGLPFDMSGYKRIKIKQAYISTKPVIRLRQSDDIYILTVKGKSEKPDDAENISVKEEFELKLDESEFSRLYELIDKKTTPIEKTRFIIPLDNGLIAELDEYYGRLSGLYTVEVEFPDIEMANAFVPPCWFGQDASNDDRYSNASLSIYGHI